jgi:hypothetical protein
MAAHTELSRREQLDAMMDEYFRSKREWRMKLPTVHAQSVAMSILREELVHAFPIIVPPNREYADIVIAGPTKGWADDFVTRLRDALPSTARVDVGAHGEGLRNGQPPTGYTVRCHVRLPVTPGAMATEKVRTALAKMEHLKVYYIGSLDLLAVAPGDNTRFDSESVRGERQVT